MELFFMVKNVGPVFLLRWLSFNLVFRSLKINQVCLFPHPVRSMFWGERRPGWHQVSWLRWNRARFVLGIQRGNVVKFEVTVIAVKQALAGYNYISSVLEVAAAKLHELVSYWFFSSLTRSVKMGTGWEKTVNVEGLPSSERNGVYIYTSDLWILVLLCLLNVSLWQV